MENNTPPDTLEMVRYIAAARILMPGSVIRLSAGRLHLSVADQAFCFYAGANSIFTGERLLTTANNDECEDEAMFKELGLEGRPAFVPYSNSGRAVAEELRGAHGQQEPRQNYRNASTRRK